VADICRHPLVEQIVRAYEAPPRTPPAGPAGEAPERPRRRPDAEA
jgi:hypothetical protein